MFATIIIPTLNQEKKLSGCLEHISNLDFNQEDFEVLVIDNGSTDNTKEVSLGFKKSIKNLNYHYCAEPGLMAARHMGANNAEGEILCFLDDDSMVAKKWLKAIAESYQDSDVAMVGGPCIPKYDMEPPEWVDYFWEETPFGRCHIYLSLIDFGDEIIEIDPVYIFGCNFSVRKNIFFELGGTNPDYLPQQYDQYQGNGETGLSLKVINYGRKAVYHPGVHIDHLIANNRLNPDYFSFKKYFIGITASYLSTRQKKGLDGFQKMSALTIDVLYRKIRKPFGKMKRSLNKVFSDNKKPHEPADIIELREKMVQKFREGYQFHQRMLKENPGLMEWVLRENYFDENANLPV